MLKFSKKTLEMLNKPKLTKKTRTTFGASAVNFKQITCFILLLLLMFSELWKTGCLVGWKNWLTLIGCFLWL